MVPPHTADWRTGTVVRWHSLTASLATFQLAPAAESVFPRYEAGQCIALRRDHCPLTRTERGSDGEVRYVPDLDETGRQKYGPVAHSYSIASAPFETAAHNRLEFYVVLETHLGTAGRLSSSLFEIASSSPDNRLSYFDRIAGTFTIAERARGFRSVLMVGTGTGVAPFVSMIKQAHHQSQANGPPNIAYTLLHANRTARELAFHEELLAIDESGRFDFVYIPSVSRPEAQDFDNPRVGCGRASNLLRAVFGMPMPEEIVDPALPAHVGRESLRTRLDPANTVVLTCGNPGAVLEIRRIAAAQGLRVETEDW